MSYVVTEPPNPYYTDADRAALNEISAKLSLGATGKTPLQIDKSNVYSYDEASQKILRNLKGSADEADFITGSKGTPESDVFIAGDADDRIKAGGGVDLIKAGDGDDLINGGNNVDQIFTGKGRDTVKIKNKPNLTGFDSIVDFSDYDIIKLVGFQPKGLRLEHYDDNTLLMHYNDVIAAVGYDINFADHVQVVR